MNDQDQNFLDLSGVRLPQEHGELLEAKHFPILEGLSTINMRILNGASRVMHVSKGVEMLHEGDAPHDLYFVHSGKLAIGKQSGGQVKIMAHLHPGDVYGEFGALRKKSRYASVYTAEPSRIIRVDLSAVQQVLEADQTFRERLNELLKQRMLDSFFFTHPVFKSLPGNVRAGLSKELGAGFFERGNRIFSQGDPPKGVFLILSGEVEVRYLNRAKSEVLLEIRRDGDMLGELAQDRGKSLAYSAVAASDLDVFVLDAAAMHTMRERHLTTFNTLEAFIDKRATRTIQRLKENLG